MQLKQIQAAIEAILFVSGDSVSLDKLSESLELNKQTLKNIIHNMMNEYNKEERGIQIIEIDGCYQLGTKSQCFEYIQKMYKSNKKHGLSQAALEVLAIIAYKQPITKAEIEYVRGVNCEWAVSRLINHNLIKEVGRMESPGKPILYGTTDEFLRHFGFRSIQDLPVLDEV